MDPQKLERVVGGIILSVGGIIGLILSILIPFPLVIFFQLTISLLIVLIIAGLILSILAFKEKLPPLTMFHIRYSQGFMYFFGTFFIVLSLVSPMQFPMMFIIGAVTLIEGGSFTWVFLRRKRNKEVT